MSKWGASGGEGRGGGGEPLKGPPQRALIPGGGGGGRHSGMVWLSCAPPPWGAVAVGGDSKGEIPPPYKINNRWLKPPWMTVSLCVYSNI